MDDDGYRNAEAASLQLLVQAVKDNYYVDHARKRGVVLLLDTDREIGKEKNTPEQRVGISPEQAGQLMEICAGLGLELTLYTVKGAGELAGFPDDEYEKVGCQLIGMDELSTLAVTPDVVHALKEPAAHEGLIPGRFIRIGALHLPTFDQHHGMYDLLRAKNFACVLDGSALGDCSYLMSQARPTPVVASMSVIAGRLAAQKVVALYPDARQLAAGKVVIIGAGVAGLAAARVLNGQCAEVVILDVNEQYVEVLHQRGLGFSRVDPTQFDVRVNTSDALVRGIEGAVGLIIASRTGVAQAEHVVDLEQISTLAPSAVVVDIAIDQGGSIDNPAIASDDDLLTKIEKYRAAIEGRGKIYFAETNMPRALPYEASIAHGAAMLPYLAGLLVLSAIHGGAEEVTSFLLQRREQRFTDIVDMPAETQGDYLQMLTQDLRNGIILAVVGGALEIANAKTAADNDLIGKLRAVWNLPMAEPVQLQATVDVTQPEGT